MSGVVFTTQFVDLLKKTLNAVWTDKTIDEKASDYKKFCSTGDPMTDAFDDDVPVAGPGYAAEVPEGGEIPVGSARQHVGHRYFARKRGLRMIITEEAVEDNKYGSSVNFAKMLKRSLAKTKDRICAQVLGRGFNTACPMVDGLPVWSASHTLAHGGTFSNLFATPMAPSVAALVVADTMARELPGLDGIKEGYMLTGIICTLENRLPWMAILGSTLDPDDINNSARVNVANKYMDLPKGVNAIRFWDNTETNYAFLTEAPNGFKYRQRRPLRVKSYMDNAFERMSHQATERYDVGLSDPRATIGVAA